MRVPTVVLAVRIVAEFAVGVVRDRRMWRQLKRPSPYPEYCEICLGPCVFDDPLVGPERGTRCGGGRR